MVSPSAVEDPKAIDQNMRSEKKNFVYICFPMMVVWVKQRFYHGLCKAWQRYREPQERTKAKIREMVIQKIIQPAKYNEELEMNPEAWVGKLVYIVTRAQTRRRKLPK